MPPLGTSELDQVSIDLLAANRDTIPDLDHMIQTGTRLMIPKKGSS